MGTGNQGGGRGTREEGWGTREEGRTWDKRRAEKSPRAQAPQGGPPRAEAGRKASEQVAAGLSCGVAGRGGGGY